MASAGMPWAAAAAVTSGSLAAPSSIEYSVWTCRCANEDSADRGLAGLLTGTCGSSVVVRARPAGTPDGRPAGETRAGASILALTEVYSEGLTGRVFSQADHGRTPSPHPSQAQGGTRDGAGPPQSRMTIVTCAIPASSYTSPMAV